MIGYFDRTMRRARKGQATAEYIIIVALIAVAAIAVVSFFGDQIRNLFSASTAKLAGDDTEGGPAGYSDAKDAAEAGAAGEMEHKKLGDF